MQKDQKSIYVMLRFQKFIRRDILVKLYKGYILPHYYYYCSSVWQLLWSAMRTSYERKVNEYLDITWRLLDRLHTELFLQKSTLLRCVTSAFRISSYFYIRVCFSLIFLLIWSKPKTTTYGLKPFLTFQLSSEMHFLTFFALVFLQTLRLKYSVTFMQILFACIHLYL